MLKEKCMFVEVPDEGISTCFSKGPKGELTEKTYDNVSGSQSLQGKVKRMEVVEDFDSRPIKVVAFLVERDKGDSEIV